MPPLNYPYDKMLLYQVNEWHINLFLSQLKKPAIREQCSICAIVGLGNLQVYVSDKGKSHKKFLLAIKKYSYKAGALVMSAISK